MKRKYRRHTKDTLEPIVLGSTSYAECLRKLEVVRAGGNYKHLQRLIDKFGISTDHFSGQAHNQGKELVPLEELTRTTPIKKRLIQRRGHRCEGCGLSQWLNLPITLELEHVDGNNRNNIEGNLQLLCPNCHSFTPTWRGRKNKKV